jgi:hypothetical protein
LDLEPGQALPHARAVRRLVDLYRRAAALRGAAPPAAHPQPPKPASQRRDGCSRELKDQLEPIVGQLFSYYCVDCVQTICDTARKCEGALEFEDFEMVGLFHLARQQLDRNYPCREHGFNRFRSTILEILPRWCERRVGSLNHAAVCKST